MSSNSSAKFVGMIQVSDSLPRKKCWQLSLDLFLGRVLSLPSDVSAPMVIIRDLLKIVILWKNRAISVKSAGGRGSATPAPHHWLADRAACHGALPPSTNQK